MDGEIIEKVEVAPFTIPGYVLGTAVPYSFTVNNEGNVDQRVDVRMVELDSSGAEVSATEITSDTALYATSSLQKSGAIEDGATRIGRANYRLVVSYPSQATGANGLIKTTEEERAVWVIPAWLPYLWGPHCSCCSARRSGRVDAGRHSVRLSPRKPTRAAVLPRMAEALRGHA